MGFGTVNACFHFITLIPCPDLGSGGTASRFRLAPQRQVAPTLCFCVLFAGMSGEMRTEWAFATAPWPRCRFLLVPETRACQDQHCHRPSFRNAVWPQSD